MGELPNRLKARTKPGRCYPGNHHLVPYWRSARSFRYRDALWPRCPPGLRGLGRSGPRFEPSSVSKRWLLSTNPKEMGSLYLLVAYEAGVDGTLFSMLVRTELALPFVSRVYNVLITAHAFLMIFFLIMRLQFRSCQL